MTADEALSRLARGCGSAVSGDESCWELEALKRDGWEIEMSLDNGTITIRLKNPRVE